MRPLRVQRAKGAHHIPVSLPCIVSCELPYSPAQAVTAIRNAFLSQANAFPNRVFLEKACSNHPSVGFVRCLNRQRDFLKDTTMTLPHHGVVLSSLPRDGGIASMGPIASLASLRYLLRYYDNVYGLG